MKQIFFLSTLILLTTPLFADDNCNCNVKSTSLSAPAVSQPNASEIKIVLEKMAKEDDKNKLTSEHHSTALKSAETITIVDMAPLIIGAAALQLGRKSCIMGPANSLDKNGHFFGNALITGATIEATDSLDKGIAVGIAASLVREAYKEYTPGMRCEWSSMLHDAAGIWVGAYLGKKFSLAIDKNGARLEYRSQF
jgi:hypothetical protein